LSVEGNVKSDKTNRKLFKKEAGVCREFGLVNSKIQTIWKKKNKIKIASALEKNLSRRSDF